MRIAICDDEQQILLNVSSQLADYQKTRQTDISCQSFSNAVDLLAAMEQENYDLLFLDILMPGLNGIEAAHEIRQVNENIEIVFLTSSPEYAVDSYSVRAANYLLKPATKEQLFLILDQLADAIRSPEEALTVQTPGNIFRIPYKNIESIEINSKTIYFCLTDGSIKKAHGSLSDYESALLTRPGFCKIHRSYIVNLNWVNEVRFKELITASGRSIPIARSSYQQVRTDYIEFLFKDMATGSDNTGK